MVTESKDKDSIQNRRHSGLGDLKIFGLDKEGLLQERSFVRC